jgi:hypothetical protein
MQGDEPNYQIFPNYEFFGGVIFKIFDRIDKINRIGRQSEF